MKIRNGFVSNSSSSSFIIGIAKVNDKKKLKNILKKIPENYKSNYVLGSFEEISNSELVNKLYYNNIKYDKETNKSYIEPVLDKIVVNAPVNNYYSVSIDVDIFDRDIVFKNVIDKDGNIKYYKKQNALWFAICLGNNEGDGYPYSPFYTYNKFEKIIYKIIIKPLNYLSRKILFPIIKILNKIFNKDWFYPYISFYPKSNYDKVKDHTFFKKDWQREIVKAFEDANNDYSNSGIFSNDFRSCVYKIGADRNG